MKKLATGIVAATMMTTSAMALDLSVTPYIQAERAIEAETNTASAGFTTEVSGVVANVQLNSFDAASNGSFSYQSTEIDFSFSPMDKVSLYLKNDFDRDFNHSESVVGARLTF